MRSIEICAGAGGQALGLEQAGFEHISLVQIDQAACATLRNNRPSWNVIEKDVKLFTAKEYVNVDLFPEAIRSVKECDPNAVMMENVRGIFDPKFEEYRSKIKRQLGRLG